jgi:hypothetical protein
MSEVVSEIMRVDQLPIIRQSLAEISEEIKRKTAEALSMICNEETVKYVKAYRAELNNQKKDLEKRRIAVKNEIMKPYDEFETIYKEMIIAPFAAADDQLKAKIDETEDVVRTRHADEVRAHFESYLANFPQIDFLPFERLGLNITKSASVPALKQQCEDFINKVADDLEMISLQADSAEIMVEYIPALNAAQAITTVASRKKAIEAQRAAAEAQAHVPLRTAEPAQDPELAKVAWVQFKSDISGEFAGQEYSYLVPKNSGYYDGERIEVEAKRGMTTARITRFGTIADVPNHILPYLKFLPEVKTIDDFDAPDPFDDTFDPPTDDPRIYTGPAKARIEVTDTIERIDALFAFLREGRYGYREI